MRDFKLHLPGRILCRISPRFHLRAICRAIGLEPYVWQRAFALGRISSLPGKRTRGNGKTTAVMLRLLMLPPGAELEGKRILGLDPDFVPGAEFSPVLWYQPAMCRAADVAIFKWYAREYRCFQLSCILARVPVSDLDTSIFRRYLP